LNDEDDLQLSNQCSADQGLDGSEAFQPSHGGLCCTRDALPQLFP
jgi:hypothetical protein